MRRRLGETCGPRPHRGDSGVASGGGSIILAFALLLCLFSSATALAQDAGAPATAPAPPPPGSSAKRLVEEGNKAFGLKDFTAALTAYAQARSLKPDALEVDFNRGLGHFALHQLDEARLAFERAALSPDPTLAEGGQYGQAAADHAQALAAQEPKEKLAKLESAMRRYQDILTANPENPHARDANRKAAMMWRMLKEEQQKQEQQQQSEDEQNKDDQEQQQNEGDGKQNQDEQEKQEQQQQSEQQQQEQKQEQQKGEQQEQQAEQQEQQEGEQQQAQAAEQKEADTKEQAERELRRLVDQLRDRMKRRDERQMKASPAPVEKDW